MSAGAATSPAKLLGSAEDSMQRKKTLCQGAVITNTFTKKRGDYVIEHSDSLENIIIKDSIG